MAAARASSIRGATPTSLPCKDRQPIPSLTAPQLVGVLSKKDLKKGGALVKVRHRFLLAAGWAMRVMSGCRQQPCLASLRCIAKSVGVENPLFQPTTWALLQQPEPGMLHAAASTAVLGRPA